MAKLLVIDDEPDMLSTLKTFLAERGYDVVTAGDGDEGLRVFDTEKPALVICDVKMPKKDGLIFLKELRSTREWVPAIIVSALDSPADVVKGYGHDADYYLAKPVNLEDVLKGVKIMLSLASIRKK